MNPHHDRMEELIAAYALDALPQEETEDAGRDLLDHLASCVDCQRLYREVRETASELALAVAPEPPTPGFRTRVMEVTQEGSRSVPARRPFGRLARGVLVASLALLVAMAGVSVYLAARLGDIDAERKETLEVLAFINDPATSVATMLGSNGSGRMTLAIRDDGRALLIGSDLSLPDDRVFEIWLLRGPDVVPAGVFVAEEGMAVVDLEVDPARDDGVAITIERGRVEQPTGTPVFQTAIRA